MYNNNNNNYPHQWKIKTTKVKTNKITIIILPPVGFEPVNLEEETQVFNH